MLSRSEIGNTNGGCSTIAVWRRSDLIWYSRTSTPSISTLPLEGSKKRGTRLRSVDFPAPVAPTIATLVPGAMLRLTSRSTGISGR